MVDGLTPPALASALIVSASSSLRWRTRAPTFAIAPIVGPPPVGRLLHEATDFCITGGMTNWPSIIADLKGAGLSLQKIAAECSAGKNQISPSTIRELLSGGSGEPRHALGVK